MKIINNSARTRDIVLGPSRGVWLLDPGVKLSLTEEEFNFLEKTGQLVKGVSVFGAPVEPAPEPETPETPPEDAPEPPAEEPTPEPPAEEPQPEPVVIPTPEETTKAHLISLANEHGVELDPNDTKAQIYAKIKEKLA